MDQLKEQESLKEHPTNKHTNQWLLPLILIIAIIVLLFMFRDFTLEDRAIYIPHEGLLEVIVGYAILIAEGAAMLVVAISVVQVTLNFLRGIFDKNYSQRVRSSETLRLRLGHRLSLALEFALASDILRVAISPALADILFLFVIILLRVLINHFLEDEFAIIKSSEKYPDLEPCDSGDN
jgi:uncharacterized membrane protein